MYLHQIRWLIQPTTAQYNTPKYVKKHINIIHFDSVAPQKYDDTALIINHDYDTTATSSWKDLSTQKHLFGFVSINLCMYVVVNFCPQNNYRFMILHLAVFCIFIESWLLFANQTYLLALFEIRSFSQNVAQQTHVCAGKDDSFFMRGLCGDVFLRAKVCKNEWMLIQQQTRCEFEQLTHTIKNYMNNSQMYKILCTSNSKKNTRRRSEHSRQSARAALIKENKKLQ